MSAPTGSSAARFPPDVVCNQLDNESTGIVIQAIIWPLVVVVVLLIIFSILTLSKAIRNVLSKLDFKPTIRPTAPATGESMMQSKSAIGGILMVFLLGVFILFTVAMSVSFKYPNTVSLETYNTDPDLDRQISVEFGLLIAPCTTPTFGDKQFCPLKVNVTTISSVSDFKCGSDDDKKTGNSACLLSWKAGVSNWAAEDINGDASIDFLVSGAAPPQGVSNSAFFTAAKLNTGGQKLVVKMSSKVYKYNTERFVQATHAGWVQTKAYGESQYCYSDTMEGPIQGQMIFSSPYTIFCTETTSLTGSTSLDCTNSALTITEATTAPFSGQGLVLTVTVPASDKIILYTPANIQELLSVIFSVMGACLTAHPILRMLIMKCLLRKKQKAMADVVTKENATNPV